MKKILLFILALAAMAACAPKNHTCTIKGVIDDPNPRNGEWIFIVPAGPHEDADVDSTIIRKGKFEFYPDSEMVAILRVHRRSRIGLQDLLVVTEPGVINVSISTDSKGGGTPQNDSLQVWKDLPRDAQYYNRSAHMARDLGDCTLGEWMRQWFPRVKD